MLIRICAQKTMWAQTANPPESRHLRRGGVSGSDVLRRPDELLREYGEFVLAFLRSPGTVGALCPSSRALARAMIAGSDLANADLVIELGPGTGSFTRVILEAIGERTSFVALELDERAVRRLRQRFSGLRVYHDSAERIQRYASRWGRNRKVDYVVSGLPWAIMPSDLQDRIMTNVAASLAPGGVFTTMAYAHSRLAPSAARYWKLISTKFSEVNVSRLVWQNLPPALVYRCVK
jgi:phospholipid N-methyltransferase